MAHSKQITVEGSWLIRSDRDSVYAIVSDFERMPERFPQVARAIRILNRDGDTLNIEAEAASFGRLFPPVKVLMAVELLPGRGYRCSTRNLTFNTTGDEQLLLLDDPEGTRIQYTYSVTLKNARLRPLHGWLTRTFGLPYWKRCFVDRLATLLHEDRGGRESASAG